MKIGSGRLVNGLLGGSTNSRKIPPISMSSGNDGFVQITTYVNFLMKTLIRGKFRRLVCQVEMVDLNRF